MIRMWTMAAMTAVLLLSGCGYNTIQSADEQVKAGWSEVINQYQRRADLVPNLVATVKGYAQQEQDVLVGVTEARAKATQMTIPSDILTNKQAFQQFEQNQANLGGALGRLMVVSERYPDLKSNENFLALQSQLEGTENRITVARNRYIEAVRVFNTTVRSFPVNLTAMVFGFAPKPSFTVEDEKAIAKPPTVDFGADQPPAPAPQ